MGLDSEQTGEELVSWCFKPNQPQRITSGLTGEEQNEIVSESDGNTAMSTVEM